MEIEAPECPICLQSYDGAAVTPRVLACGHSACEECLSQLPRPFSVPAVVRCPACTQIVHFPQPLGAAALPKNIDLLRLSLLLLDDKLSPERKPSSSRSQPEQKTSHRRRGFSSPLWSDEIYTAWKDWILPRDSVLIVRGGRRVSVCDAEQGRVVGLGSDSSSVSPLIRRVKVEQEVNFVKVGGFDFNVSASALEYGYVGKVMCVLSRMSGERRKELALVLMLSLRSQLRICDIYGLWLDDESGSLYLVSERKNSSLLELDGIWANITVQQEEDGLGTSMDDRVSGLAVICMELCEALVGLQSEGFVCGCLGLSCLRMDDFGHVYIDLCDVIVMLRKLKCISMAAKCSEKISDLQAEEIIRSISTTDMLVNPEVLLQVLKNEGVPIGSNDLNCIPDAISDVWVLSCVFIRLVAGKQFVEDMYKYLSIPFQMKGGEPLYECEASFMNWVLTVSDMLEASIGANFMSAKQTLVKCLDFNPQNRPPLTDMWKVMKEMTINSCLDGIVSLREPWRATNIEHCFALGELSSVPEECKNELRMEQLQDECREGPEGAICPSQALATTQEKGLTESLSLQKVLSTPLKQHRDCVTGLTVGGEFLFSCSFDKTINVWSMQEFTHMHTFRGPEHRIMAVVFANEEQPMCICGDNGGGIFIWRGSAPFCQEPLKKWYEQKDWRYSGIYALAAPGTGYLYSGGGDRLIKAWSLLDSSLLCTMEGHKSVVSALAVCNGVLNSGSWDGTVRLWNLHDHSPLAVLGDDMPGAVASIHSIYADHHTIIAAHENGFVKIWLDDEFNKSIQVHDGAIFAVGMEGTVLYTGGWDKSVKIQEIKGDGAQLDMRQVGSISCDSVITSLLCAQGVLFVGCASGLIKVYHHE